MANSLRWVLGILTGLLSLLVILVGGELLVRFAAPQPYLYPRWQYSGDYGHVLYSGTTMVHAMPRHFEYRYGINSLGYRGRRVPISNHYVRQNIVILGDSYSFGTGVQDGEEFSVVMERALGTDFETINLAVGGWGLPQQIRRFYEFGILYQPRVVILQFCANGLTDGLRHRVARIENDRFVFQSTKSDRGWLRDQLSKSVLQRSQLYNLLRQFLYDRFDGGLVLDARVGRRPPAGVMEAATAPTAMESAYLELLSAFALDLRQRGIPLLVISVNGQLEGYPALVAGVARLNEAGTLHYVDVRPWFDGVTAYESPEGHSWGIKAHAILGAQLAEQVRALQSQRGPD